MRACSLTFLFLLGCPGPGKPLDTSTPTWADADGDGYDERSDCDDQAAEVYPGADELCNGRDDDCDGFVDTDDPGLVDGGVFYADSDGDGYGDPGATVAACRAPSGYVVDDGDCDDEDPSVHPAADEQCNGVDDDCDGSIDDGLTSSTWYPDRDSDGYGDSTAGIEACEAPGEYIAEAGDCDDGDAAVHPGATELCNGVDDDCDTEIDEGLDWVVWYADVDLDGYGDPDLALEACAQPSGHVARAGDCDDSDGAVSPAATEVCDGLDNDCDGLVDSDDDSVTGSAIWYSDSDGDSYGDASSITEACSQPPGTVADATDCDDSDAAINPGATELCNGVDDDCDGSVDVGAVDIITWYADDDGDAYGDATDSVTACYAPSGYVADATDCDDTDATVYPGASEYCNGQDNDCDGVADNGALDMSTWYADADGDAYGDASTTIIGCTLPTGYVADATDCDDADATVYPGATETCNGVDDDCDGTVDEAALGAGTWYADIDGDGYGDPATGIVSCTAIAGRVTDNTDCDDTAIDAHPGATEYCDGVDTDCDGTADPSSIVTFEDSSGAKSDVTRTFTLSTSATPNTYSFTSDGTLYLCAGSYSALVEVSAADASIVGVDGSALTVLSAGYYGVIINALSGAASLGVSGLSLIEGSGANGGAISSIIAGLDFAGADLVVSLSLATNGGGIYLKDADSISLQDVELSSCAANKGGGLYVDEGLLDFDDLWVSANAAADQGGGMYIKDASGSLAGLIVADNLASSKGGGMYVDDSFLSLEDSVLSDNISSDQGGGMILETQAELTMSSTVVEANIAVSGGGAFLDDSSLECVGTSTGVSYEGFVGNLATEGGAVLVKGNNGELEADTCDFGAGSDDNSLDDVFTDHTDNSYSYGDDESFTCDKSSCW